MSDQEKTLTLVEKLFVGKVEHSFPDHLPTVVDEEMGISAVACVRCGQLDVSHDLMCFAFNPFQSIEDAFLCVEKLNPLSAVLQYGGAWRFDIFGAGASTSIANYQANDPARAIAEACWLAVKE